MKLKSKSKSDEEDIEFSCQLLLGNVNIKISPIHISYDSEANNIHGDYIFISIKILIKFKVQRLIKIANKSN